MYYYKSLSDLKTYYYMSPKKTPTPLFSATRVDSIVRRCISAVAGLLMA
jgi:hypothetical protein